MNTLMQGEDLKVLQERFNLQYEGEYGNMFVGKDSNLIICEMTQAYTPIEDFMSLLEQKRELIKKYGCEKFIFDKRAIKGFHQPSMEWYYLTWKVDMYNNFKLAKHRKLFTTDGWFLKCIEAGRAEIKRKDPGSIVHTLDIKVCKDLKDAIES
jgi:hypothetical protein